MILQIITWVFTILVSAQCCAIIVMKRDMWLPAYRHFSWRLFLANVPVLAAVVFVGLTLMSVSPRIMGFSWLSLLGGQGTNLNVSGASIPYFGIIFCILLLLALPVLADVEEKMFREGTRSWWPDGIIRSTKFGLVHILVGIPVGFGFALIIGGLYFTFLYFKGGTRLSAQAHFQYNFVAVMLLLISAIIITIS